MLGWLFGALVAAGFAVIGGAQVVVVVTERGPTTISCAALLETGTTARWVRLSGCHARWEHARPFADRRLAKALYLPLDPGREYRPNRLLVRIEADADRNVSTWEGLLDVRATEARPPFAAHSTRILYLNRPDPVEIFFTIAAPLLYLGASGAALRRRARRRAAFRKLVGRFAATPGPPPPGLRVLNLDPLLAARRTLKRALQVVAGTLVLLLGVAAAPLLERRELPPTVWLTAVAAPVFALLVSAWLWRRSPTDRRLAIVGSLAFVLVVFLVLAAVSAPRDTVVVLAFVPAPLAVAGVMARTRWRLRRRPDWATLAAVDLGVTRVRAQRRPRHESLRRRPLTIMLYRTAALSIGGFGLIVAGALRVSVIFWLAAAAGIVLWRRARRHATLDAREVQEHDPRAPVTLLRSFADDELEMSGLPELIWSPPTTLSWVAADQLASIGPVVAVGEPGERLPPLGPYRLFLPAGPWHEEVDRLVASSRAVFLVLGQSRGVLWELERVLSREATSPVAVIVPPAAPDDLERRWEIFLDLTKSHHVWRLAHHLDPTTLVLFRVVERNAALAICAARPDGAAYALAFSVCAALEAGVVPPGIGGISQFP